MKKKYLLTVLSLSAMATAMVMLGTKDALVVKAEAPWLNNVVSQNDDRSASVITSTLDGAHIRVNNPDHENTSGADQYVSVVFDHPDSLRNWSAGEGFVIEFENQSWSWTNINFELISDPGWHFFCADGTFTDPTSDPTVLNQAYFYWNLNDLETRGYSEVLRMSYANESVNPCRKGYLYVPFEAYTSRGWEPSVPYLTPISNENPDNTGHSFLENIVRVNARIDAKYCFNDNITIASYGYRDATTGQYVKVFDGKQAVLNETCKWDPNEYFLDSGLKTVELQNVEADHFYFENKGNLQWTAFYLNTVQNISAANGIKYYVDNTIKENQPVLINKFIEEYTSGNAMKEQWYSVDSEPAYFQPDEGEPFAGLANNIPAGFKGTIYVPFTSFAVPDWAMHENGELDTEWVSWNFGFTFNTQLTEGTTELIIKDFAYYENAGDTAPELYLAKKDYKGRVDSLVNLDDYTGERKTELGGILDTAKAAIDAKTATAEIKAAYNAAVEDVKAKIAEYAEADRQAIITVATTECQAYYDALVLDNYRQAQKEELAALLAGVKVDLEDVEDQDEADELIAEFKDDVDAVQTDAELAEEELAAYKGSAKTALQGAYDGLTLSDYRQAQQEELAQILATALAAIDDAESEAAVDAIGVQCVSDLMQVKTDAQLTAEEQQSEQPSVEPSEEPSVEPSEQPSEQPSVAPSVTPSVQPSEQPSEQPSAPAEDTSKQEGGKKKGCKGEAATSLFGLLTLAGALILRKRK